MKSLEMLNLDRNHLAEIPLSVSRLGDCSGVEVVCIIHRDIIICRCNSCTCICIVDALGLHLQRACTAHVCMYMWYMHVV